MGNSQDGELLRLGSLRESDFTISPQKLEIAQEMLKSMPYYKFLEINSCSLDPIHQEDFRQWLRQDKIVEDTKYLTIMSSEFDQQFLTDVISDSMKRLT